MDNITIYTIIKMTDTDKKCEYWEKCAKPAEYKIFADYINNQVFCCEHTTSQVNAFLEKTTIYKTDGVTRKDY